MILYEYLLVFIMIRVLIVLLISFIPIFIYCFLYNNAKKEAIAKLLPAPSFMNEKLLKAFIQSLVLASICFITLIIFYFCSDLSGKYIPATIINGEFIKGHVNK